MDNMLWVAVFLSSGGTLKLDIVCFSRTASIPNYFVSVWKGTILMLF